ncbi:hypothetical protein J4426_00480 [Candidatus Woesearchaeota archaeon]|nr:hypothetical protein [Candidatus Woesearchaeota archaeon]
MAARLEYMFCLDFTGNGNRLDSKQGRGSALIIGFNRWWVISELVDTSIGQSHSRKISKITQPQYEGYLALITLGRYDHLFEDLLNLPTHIRVAENYAHQTI